MLKEMKVNVLGFESMEEIYENDPNFGESWEAFNVQLKGIKPNG